MRCSSCGKSNLEDRRLCVFCGDTLGPPCPWCGFSNPPEDVFCRGCKAALSDPASSIETDNWPPESLDRGRYRIVRALGDCGAGRVYLAHDLTLDRQVAITLVTVAAPGDAPRMRVLGLARSMAALCGKPRIIGIYDAGEENGHPYVVSEYPGTSLMELLEKSDGRRLPVLDALRLAEGICEALEVAHSFGIVHGGLSPVSVFLTSDGFCKVGGFGFGLPLAIELSALVGEMVEFGAIAYLAPEQMIARENEPQADLYALGAILYQAMTGVAPLGDASTGHFAVQIGRKPMPPSWRRSEIPHAVDTLLGRLLRKSPDLRPSASVVLSELRSIISSLEKPPPAAVAVSQSGHETARPWPIVSFAGRFADLVTPARLAFAATAAIAIVAASAILLTSRVHKIESAKLEPGKSPIARGAPLAARPGMKPAPPAAKAAPQPYSDLLELASEGDVGAATALGNILLRGEGTAINYAQALHWLQLGASRGDAQAQAGLGYMYASGQGVAQDYREAARWFTLAAKQDDSEAQYDLALIYQDSHGDAIDSAEALRWLRRSAARDNPRAEYELGRRYLEGDGITQDYGRALQWLRKAADQGNVGAQNALGYMYEQGRGVLRDYVQALEWYRKAAAQGDAKAELNLGLMYEAGEGVAQDYTQAMQWYKKAADQGVAYAQTSIGVMYCKSEGVKQDYNQALNWFLRAAEQGEPKAQYNLGVMYDTGLGVAVDRAQAARWYRKAALKGNVDAQYNLGYLYEHGQGVSRNYVEALEWYRKAAGHGDNTALKRVRDLETPRSTISPDGTAGKPHKKPAADTQANQESD